MTHLRLLGLLAITIGVLGLASHASATTLTSPEGTAYTGGVAATSEAHTVLDNPIAKIECPIKLAGEVKSHGAGSTVKVELSSLTTLDCTDGWHFTTVSPGNLEIHWTSGENGIVTSSGETIEATRFGLTCRYATNNTQLGTLTGGSPATLDINASIPFHSGSIFCGSGATAMTGSLAFTTPGTLTVDS